jgi:hypothetical protein
MVRARTGRARVHHALGGDAGVHGPCWPPVRRTCPFRPGQARPPARPPRHGARGAVAPFPPRWRLRARRRRRRHEGWRRRHPVRAEGAPRGAPPRRGNRARGAHRRRGEPGAADRRRAARPRRAGAPERRRALFRDGREGEGDDRAARDDDLDAPGDGRAGPLRRRAAGRGRRRRRLRGGAHRGRLPRRLPGTALDHREPRARARRDRRDLRRRRERRPCGGKVQRRRALGGRERRPALPHARGAGAGSRADAGRRGEEPREDLGPAHLRGGVSEHAAVAREPRGAGGRRWCDARAGARTRRCARPAGARRRRLQLHRGAHGPDERMELASLTSSTKRAAVLVARLLRGAR